MMIKLKLLLSAPFLLLLVFLIFPISLIEGQETEEATKKIGDVTVGGEDLNLEMQDADNHDIIKFQIPSTNYSQICPSNQCEIEIIYSYFGAPTPDDDSPIITVRIQFYLHDDITNSDLTPAQRLFIEKFDFNIWCDISNINQIIQDKDGEVVYHCDSDSGSVGPVESSSTLPTLYYSYKVVYDTKSETLKLSGKFDRVDQ